MTLHSDESCFISIASTGNDVATVTDISTQTEPPVRSAHNGPKVHIAQLSQRLLAAHTASATPSKEANQSVLSLSIASPYPISSKQLTCAYMRKPVWHDAKGKQLAQLPQSTGVYAAAGKEETHLVDLYALQTVAAESTELRDIELTLDECFRRI